MTEYVLRSASVASLLRHRNLALGGSIVLVVLLTGLLAPLLAPYDPYAQNLSVAFQSPGFPHIFGTDEYGRDWRYAVRPSVDNE